MPTTRTSSASVQPTPLPVMALGVLLIALAAIYRGGNRWLPLTAIEWLSLALLVLLASAWQAGPASRSLAQAARFWVLALAMTSPFWMAALQLVPLPASLWNDVPGRQVFLGSSVDGTAVPLSMLPDETWRSALSGVPVLAGFALGLLVPERSVALLIRVWLVTAAVQAGLGLLQLGFPALAFSDAPLSSAQGSFGSRNSLGNYLAMLLPVALLLAMNGAQAARGSRRGSAPGQWRWRAVLLLLLAGLIASTSRAGIATGVLVVLLAWALFPRDQGHGADHSNPRLQPWLARMLPLGLLVFAMASGGWSWLERFETGDASRLLNWAATWQGAQAFWPVGSGLGTFSSVFPYFQPPELGRWFVNFAHNDYLQLLMECGVLVVPVMVGLLWLIGRRAVQLAVAGRRRALSGADTLALACGLGFLAQALHAWVDYPWRIPATAMLGAFLLGVFLREPEGRPHQRHGA